MKRFALAPLLATLVLVVSSGAAAAQGGEWRGLEAGAPQGAPPSPMPVEEQAVQSPAPSDGSEPASSPAPGGSAPADAPMPSLAPWQLAGMPSGNPSGAVAAAVALGSPEMMQAPAPWAGAPMPQPAAAPPGVPGAGGNGAPGGPSPEPLSPSPAPSGGGNAGQPVWWPPPATVEAASVSPPADSPSPSPSPDLPAPPPDFVVTEDPPGPPTPSVSMPPPPVGESPAPSPSPSVESPQPASPSPAVLSPSPAPAPSPPPAANTQAQALLEFKAGTSNGETVLASWTSPSDNPCSGSWVGVSCDASGQNVVGLNLTGQGLAGTISASLAQLPALTAVDLSANQFTGSLPDPWQQGTGNAAQLTTLYLHSNFLAGALPALALSSLANATLHDNWLTGSVPTSWSSQLPGSAGVSILPQGTKGGLCGAVPSSPVLLVTPQDGAFYQASNSLGSCLQSQCSGQKIVSLANSNIYSVAVAGNATVWDTAALNGWTGTNPDATSVKLPCYQAGSPVDGYLGGDMAYMMLAWSNGADSAGSLVSSQPGQSVTCGQQGAFWTVDLRLNLTLSQVVIKAGPSPGINVNVAVSDSPALGSGTSCATGVSATDADVAVSCAATGRYLTISSTDSSSPMALCSVAVYPEVANVAANKPIYYTSSDGSNQQGTYGPNSGPIQVSASSSQAPTFVLDLGSSSSVTAVVLANAQDVASVSITTSNPLPAAASRRRSLQQSGAPAPAEAAGGAQCAASGASDGSYLCPSVVGDFVVVQGSPGSQLGFDSIAVFLGQPPGPAAPPPPPIAPTPPAPAGYQKMWVGNLLVGGNIGNFVVDAPYTTQLLVAYNRAWSAALADAGYSIDPSASAFNQITANVANPSGSPYYYDGSATGANLFTNTSVAVDYRLTYDTLYQLLSTDSVAQSIETNTNLSAYRDFAAWMVPYTAPAPPPSGSSGLATGAIVGIAVGGAAVVLAIALLVFCCLCRRKTRRQDSGASKASSLAGLHDEQHGRMESGTLRNQYPGGTFANPLKAQPSQQLAEARKLYAQPDDANLPYGSAFSNGAPAAAAAAGAAAAAAGAVALASRPSHSRTASDNSSSGPTASGGGGGSNSRELSTSTPRSASQDPVLALILKSQAEKQASAGQSSTGGSARSTPKHRPSGSKANLDVRFWQFSYSDLEIQKQIGEGSFGRVYVALWRETQVAVKILMSPGKDIEDVDDAERALTLSNPLLQDLEKEASMMAALRHPNIVAFLGVCAEPPAVVTEYCRRGSLTDVLRGGKVSAKQAKLLDWTKRLNMALDAAKGMLYLHQHSPPIIHRDLKSPNLLVDAFWRVKVSDFNLSKLMEDNAVMSSMAATNPRWLAPEILAGGKASRESDVYAFGVVLWELLTWDIPWGTTNPWQVVTIVSDGGRLEIPSRDQLPGPDAQDWVALDAYVGLLQRCWAQEPCDRPSFKEIISEMRDMLERTLAARGVLAGAAGAAGTPQQNDGALSGSGSGAGGAARAGSDSTASDGVVRVSGASASAAATTPGAAGQLHKQQSGSGGPPVASRGSGYSSMAAEVGSMAEGAPRSALDSQLGGSSRSRR